jgi:hypothetical protein
MIIPNVLMIAPGQIYRHYKGNLYTITNIAILESNKEILVIYTDSDKNTWARPIYDFMSLVSVDDTLVRRFALIAPPQSSWVEFEY